MFSPLIYLMNFEVLVQKNENWQFLLTMKRPRKWTQQKMWLTWGQNIPRFFSLRRRVKFCRQEKKSIIKVIACVVKYIIKLKTVDLDLAPVSSINENTFNSNSTATSVLLFSTQSDLLNSYSITFHTYWPLASFLPVG